MPSSKGTTPRLQRSDEFARPSLPKRTPEYGLASRREAQSYSSSKRVISALRTWTGRRQPPTMRVRWIGPSSRTGVLLAPYHIRHGVSADLGMSLGEVECPEPELAGQGFVVSLRWQSVGTERAQRRA